MSPYLCHFCPLKQGGTVRRMVCEKCEAKLSNVIVPDKWKDGARNTTGGEGGGRRVGHENMLLKHGSAKRRNNRFTPVARVCRICKSKVNQQHHYCQECAFQKGICGMCGRKTDDISNQRRTAKKVSYRKGEPQPKAPCGDRILFSEK